MLVAKLLPNALRSGKTNYEHGLQVENGNSSSSRDGWSNDIELNGTLLNDSRSNEVTVVVDVLWRNCKFFKAHSVRFNLVLPQAAKPGILFSFTMKFVP